MSVELLQMLSLIAYVLAGIFLLISVALFFRYKVRDLIGDLSGANARKAIENIRQQNETTGDKAYKPSAVNMARGRVTDKMTSSGRLQPKSEDVQYGVGTEKFGTDQLMAQAQETTVLDQPDGETTVLVEPSPETTILEPAAETTLLYENQPQQGFQVDVDMGFRSTDEIIE